MASWMVHLRIADKLLDRIPGLTPVEFIVGNMAPDSGVPNEDWTKFFPSTQVSHFRTDDGSGKKQIDLDAYLAKYFSPALRESYDQKQYSFYLGYYTHLLTDVLWSDRIAVPTMEKFSLEFAADKRAAMARVKEDWYDLDYLYLRKNAGFRTFEIYRNAAGFCNTFMEEFSPDAFDNRREYIVGFYLQPNDNLDRDYPYLTEGEAERFTSESAARILDILNAKFGIQ